METKVIRQNGEFAAIINGVEVFRGKTTAAANHAHDLVDAAKAHEGPYEAKSEVRNNRRVYFVKAGEVTLKESANAGKIHDFADRLNGVVVNTHIASPALEAALAVSGHALGFSPVEPEDSLTDE